jgi:uncharacterized membrane protein
MKAMIALGVLLILLGIAILSYQWATYTTSSGVFQSAGTQEQ